MSDLAEKVLDIVSRETEIPREELSLDSGLENICDDSLSFLEMIVHLRSEISEAAPRNALINCSTIGELVEEFEKCTVSR